MAAARVAMVLNTMGLGGVPEVAYQFMRHLPRDRFEPRLCVLKDAKEADASRARRQSRFDEIGVRVHYATRGSGKLDAVAEVARWLDAERIDLLHTHSYRPNVYARMAGALVRPAGLRTVAHYHNQYDDKWDADPVMLTLERQLARGCDAMIAVSQSVRTHIAERVGIDASRIDVVHNGVPDDHGRAVDRHAARQALGIETQGPVLGLVGRVCDQKGQEDFVEAAIGLSNMHHDVLFLMIGDLEDKALAERLRARISATGNEARIRFTGHIADMTSVYPALDVLVAPSRWEGFGLMLVEAMAAGLPIVAARAGAIPEIVEDGETAFLVPPRDPAALSEAMATVIVDAEARTRLGEAGRRRQALFTWPAATRRLTEIYDRVLGRRQDGS